MKKKSSDRREAAHTVITPAAGIGIAAAASRVGPLVQQAATRVGPLAQSAAHRVGPLAQSAAGRMGPIAQSAAGRFAPVAGRVTPFASQAVGYVSPYANRAAGYVAPLALLAAARVAPLTESARLHSAQFAHGAVEKITPRLEDAWGRVTPVVEAANHRVNDDLLPRLSGALAAAAASPVAAEAGRRGRATLAAARGELTLPVVPEAKTSRGWVTGVAVTAALGGIAVVAAKKMLGSKDADWQSARPSAVPTTSPVAGSTTDASTTAETTGPLNWAVATGQADSPTGLTEEMPEHTAGEHVGEPSLPAGAVSGAAPGTMEPEKLPTSDLPMSEAPRTGDASESNMPAKDGTRTTGDSTGS